MHRSSPDVTKCIYGTVTLKRPIIMKFFFSLSNLILLKLIAPSTISQQTSAVSPKKNTFTCCHRCLVIVKHSTNSRVPTFSQITFSVNQLNTKHPQFSFQLRSKLGDSRSLFFLIQCSIILKNYTGRIANVENPIMPPNENHPTQHRSVHHVQQLPDERGRMTLALLLLGLSRS